MLNETVNETPNVTNLHSCKRLSWTAVFVGAIVGVGLSFLLGLFGAAIGLSIFSMGANGVTTLAVGGLIGIVLSIIVSMLVAGYTAGYLGRLYCPRRNLGVLYGFTAWSVALMLSALLTTHMSAYLSPYSAGPAAQVNVGSPQALPSSQAPTTVAPTKGTNATSTTTENTSSPLTVQTSASQSSNGNQVITVQASPNALAWGAFIFFGLFFIGAFFCCIGACWGMNCRRED
ncbi:MULTISPECIES: hypothetical protein [Legionella]|uniref:Transmembrane protein n=1 Tax=Legionella drozanskii LLAP-1 TaxID=1212489 RepID=A0A0W0TC75_9GAMM|nr:MULTISPECIES: hypothetical protein [Legionella]KTC93136.1 hypothetical protein Ldro_0507 [Legionella drozanskii LLAP-1]PJE09361.1 MAG: hypothetical protein CK430_11250 [Legionella sp.]